MFSDSGMLTNGKIPPLTRGIRTLENLVDSTDAEYEEDRKVTDDALEVTKMLLLGLL